MQETPFEVENIKCGGCSASIVRALDKLPGVDAVRVIPESQTVIVTHGDDWDPALVAERLEALGYPLAGSVAGLSGVGAKARSFVSCAVGRFSGES